MKTDWLPDRRYLFRELIPRAILLTATFKYVLPVVPFGLFHFHGGLGMSLAFGLAFTTMFCLLGAYLMGSAPVVKFMDANSKTLWFIPANIVFALGAPALMLALANFVAPATFAMSGVIAALAGSIILNIVCAITHDYGANRQ